MTAVSQTLQTLMRFQQQIAEMAIKGDDVFEALLGHNEEEPEWATFDEDDGLAPSSASTSTPDDDSADTSAPSAAAGRFALYSSAPDIDVDDVQPVTTASADDVPEIVELLDYNDLTLAQLRAKLKTVGLPELQDLAAYERSHRSRAPFLTMLDNRVTAASK
jgi:hypothetical protein